jgi:acyl carrier protein
LAETDAVLGRVKRLILDQLDVKEDEIALGSRFIDDLGADSLDIVELIMAIEEEFEIEIPDEHAERITSVGDAVAYIKQHE